MNQSLLSWCEENGLKNGLFEQFSVKNGVEVRAVYVDGKLGGEFTRFWPDGRPAVSGEFKDGEMSGQWTRFREDGTKQDQGSWLRDKPTGPWKYFDASGAVIREVTYDDHGKIIPPKETGLRTSDSFRLRMGLSHSGGGSNNGDNGGPMLGADLHLFQLGRIVRSELSVRIGPDKVSNDNNGNCGGMGPCNNGAKGTYSGELALGLEPLPALLDPFAFTIRIGPHFADFKKPHLLVGLGLRYQWQERRKGFHMPGAFFEFGGIVDDNGNNNGNNNCGGPNGCNGNSNGNSNFASAGLLFTL